MLCQVKIYPSTVQTHTENKRCRSRSPIIFMFLNRQYVPIVQCKLYMFAYEILKNVINIPEVLTRDARHMEQTRIWHKLLLIE